MRVETTSEGKAARSFADVPWTVVAYAAVSIISVGVWTALGGDIARASGAGLMSLLIAVGLAKGYRAVWGISVILAALGVLGMISLIGGVIWGSELRPQDYVSMMTWAITTALLLHPSTRAWASR